MERFRDGVRERGDLGRGLEEIGHHDDAQACAVRGADAGEGILERVAGAWESMPRRRTASRKMSGSGLPRATWSPVTTPVKNFSSPTDSRRWVATGLRVEVATARGMFCAERLGKQFADAGLERQAVALDDFLEENAGRGVDALEIEAGAEMLAHEIAGITLGAANHEREDGVGHLVTGGARGFLPGDPRDALGVDHEAVHVEDDAGVGGT